jgi:hypothetical protein
MLKSGGCVAPCGGKKAGSYLRVKNIAGSCFYVGETDRYAPEMLGYFTLGR